MKQRGASWMRSISSAGVKWIIPRAARASESTLRTSISWQGMFIVKIVDKWYWHRVKKVIYLPSHNSSTVVFCKGKYKGRAIESDKVFDLGPSSLTLGLFCGINQRKYNPFFIDIVRGKRQNLRYTNAWIEQHLLKQNNFSLGAFLCFVSYFLPSFILSFLSLK